MFICVSKISIINVFASCTLHLTALFLRAKPLLSIFFRLLERNITFFLLDYTALKYDLLQSLEALFQILALGLVRLAPHDKLVGLGDGVTMFFLEIFEYVLINDDALVKFKS